METKVIPFGTERAAFVVRATKDTIIVHASDGQGYVLLAHGLDPLPPVGETGTITFTQGGPMGGYWKYEGPIKVKDHAQNT